MFVAELEEKLRKAHKPRKTFSLSSLNIMPTLGWSLTLVALIVLMNWVLANKPQTIGTGDDFICPVTAPNGSLPPGETVESPDYLGNGELWTVLWPDGKIIMQTENQEPDGSLGMKWGWWRAVNGPLTIEGRRLDATSEPLRADIPDGYGDTGFQVSSLIFPAPGCWEVTGRVGESSLTFVTEVVDGEPTPTPKASVLQDNNDTQNENGEGIDFRGAKLILNTALPAGPSQTNLYRSSIIPQATEEYTRQLAQRFGIEGDIYNEQSYSPSWPAFMVTDGKQILRVYDESNFSYISDNVKASRSPNGFESENAESSIRAFLNDHDLGFDFTVKYNTLFGGYQLIQTAPDGLPMTYEYFSQPVMRITLDDNGNVLSLTALLMKYDPAPLGQFEIISSEEAFQRLLDDTAPAGKIESMAGGPAPKENAAPIYWYRDYPNDQLVTLYGNVQASKSTDPSKPAAVFVDNFFAIGNTKGMDELNSYTFAEVTGTFIVENGVRKLNVDSWNTDAQMTSMYGAARQENGNIIVSSFNMETSEVLEEYVLVDPPVDLPLNTKYPESQLAVTGAIVNNELQWTNITYFPDSSMMGGGGGGGGMGFYQLNLSGTPIPFPEPGASQPAYSQAELASFLRYTVKEGDTLSQIAERYNVSMDEIKSANYLQDESIFIGQLLTIPGVPGPTRLDGAEGIVQVQIFQKPDGRMREQYVLLTKDDGGYYELIGDDLTPLQAVANLPVKVWGSIEIKNDGQVLVSLEKFETLYPDLEIQIVTGTQESTQVNGQQVTLFTTGGTTYMQMVPSGSNPDNNYYPDTPEVQAEAMIIPGETYAGYPVLRVFNSAPTIDPTSGQPIELYRSTGKIEVMPDPFGNQDKYIQPDLIIDNIELVYFTSSPFATMDAPELPKGGAYIQPAWRFTGHYTNGGQVDILIQALKQEYLTPLTDTYLQPG
jgi:LysM repeat protein